MDEAGLRVRLVRVLAAELKNTPPAADGDLRA